MQLYKTTARFYGTVNGVPDVETVTTVWSGSMASAGSDRAKAVADYLVSQGVAADAVASKGAGSSEPVASNDTEEGRTQNRRTEIKVS